MPQSCVASKDVGSGSEDFASLMRELEEMSNLLKTPIDPENKAGLETMHDE